MFPSLSSIFPFQYQCQHEECTKDYFSPNHLAHYRTLLMKPHRLASVHTLITVFSLYYKILDTHDQLHYESIHWKLTELIYMWFVNFTQWIMMKSSAIPVYLTKSMNLSFVQDTYNPHLVHLLVIYSYLNYYVNHPSKCLSDYVLIHLFNH